MKKVLSAKMSAIMNKSITLGEALSWFGVLLALLALGAHYFRSGNYLMTESIAVVLALHLGAAAWKRLVVGAFLAWGATEWAASVFSLINWRVFMGVPWARGAAILALVALLTALAAFHTFAKARKLLSAAPAKAAFAKAFSFILVFGALYAMRLRNPDILVLERFFPAWGGIEIAALAWYAAFVTGGLMSSRSRKTRRTAWLIFSFVFFGQMALGLAGVQGMRTLESYHIPIPGMIIFGAVYRGEPGFMPFLVLGATLLIGGAWCGMLCYFGPLESAVCSGKPVKKPSPFLAAALRYGRIGSLAAGSLVALILRLMEYPATTAAWFGAGFAILSLAIMILASWRYTGMTHCSAFCPLGLIINLAGRLSPWRIKTDRGVCDNCGACEKVCAHRAIDAASRQRGGASFRCVLCRDCMAVCPRSAISMTFPFLKPEIAETVFIVILTALHAIFIATARPL